MKKKIILKQNNIHLLFKTLIYITFLVVCFNFYEAVNSNKGWQYTDWLINYQGGFTRRGLAGELILRFSLLTKIHFNLLLLFIVFSLYFIFYKELLLIIKETKIKLIDLFILLSPLSFFYPVMESKISGRKEIIFFVLLILLFKNINKIAFSFQKYLILMFTIIAFLVHSGFILYSPYFIVVFLLANHKKNIKKLGRELILMFLLISLSILTIFFSFTKEVDITLLCEPIKQFYINCGNLDYISTLNWSFEYQLSRREMRNNLDSFNLFYFIAFLYAFIPIIFLFKKSKFEINKNIKFNSIYIILIPFISTLPIYYIAGDWGRYLFLSYISSLLIYLFCRKLNIVKFNFSIDFLKKKNNLYLIVLIFLYSFVLTIPHCCNNNFKFIYQKPISNILNKI